MENGGLGPLPHRPLLRADGVSSVASSQIPPGSGQDGVEDAEPDDDLASVTLRQMTPCWSHRRMLLSEAVTRERRGLPGGLVVNNPPATAGCTFSPGLGEVP